MIFVDKQAIAIAFGRAAHNYSRYDELQRKSVHGLLSLLAERNFSTVLDAGCGPGSNSLYWRTIGSNVTALDLSFPMLKEARAQKSANAYLIADIEAIPLVDGQFDLVWSHLAVQWCNSLSQALAELYRVTRPGGCVAFTTILENSLKELNQAWLAVDTQLHTNRFLSRDEVEKAYGPWRIHHYEQSITLYFDDALSAMRSLKGIGATHLHNGRLSKLFTRRQLQRLELAWPQQSGRYPLTYRLFHGVIERD